MKKLLLIPLLLLGCKVPSTPVDPAGPTIAGCQIFPADNPWNQKVDTLPVHEKSESYMRWMAYNAPESKWVGLHPDFGTTYDGVKMGMEINIVEDVENHVVTFDYPDESDAGPYPIPDNPLIEEGSDHHMLILERPSCILYELFDARYQAVWLAGSGAIFPLDTNKLRPDYWTSADAAGLPIAPGLVRYSEVMNGKIEHALRFTSRPTQRAFIHPATHFASSSRDENHPPMGVRVRLKKDFDLSTFPIPVQVIGEALKTYGMFLADNGGRFFLSGEHHPGWDNDEMRRLRLIGGEHFDVVYTGELIK